MPTLTVDPLAHAPPRENCTLDACSDSGPGTDHTDTDMSIPNASTDITHAAATGGHHEDQDLLPASACDFPVDWGAEPLHAQATQTKQPKI